MRLGWVEPNNGEQIQHLLPLGHWKLMLTVQNNSIYYRKYPKN